MEASCPPVWPEDNGGRGFLHCGRTLIRSRLWDPDAQIDRSVYPTYGRVLADQIAGADAKQIDDSEDEANRERLY